jgi:hypothetical protein
MGNVDNECKDLEIVDRYKDLLIHDDPFETMFNHQKEMQKTTYGYITESMSIAQVKDYLLLNQHALVDEFHEMIDALGGIKDGILIIKPNSDGTKASTDNPKGSAAWKPWKNGHLHYGQVKIDELSDGDLLELKFEFIDMLHFFMNMGAAIGMTPKEMFNMYMTKAQENKDRQAKGY